LLQQWCALRYTTTMQTVRGVVSFHPRGFGFVTHTKDGQPLRAFVAPPLLNQLLDGDVVDAQVEASGEDRFQATRLTLVARNRMVAVGDVVKNSFGVFLKVDPLIGNTTWPLHDAAALAPGVVVRARLDPVRGGFAGAVAIDDKKIDEERILARHDIDANEDDVPLPTATDTAHRRDIRELPLCTIDGPSTKDIDDAVYCHPPDDEGGLRVVVAIADVDAAMPAGSALDERAQRRATSVYLQGRVIPMLPRALSEDALSLLPDVERNAMVVEFRVAPEGDVTAVDVFEARMKSHARLTYDDVAHYLNVGVAHASISDALQPVLRRLQAAAARLSQARAARGGMEHESDEIHMVLDRDGNPVDIEVNHNTCAHVLIERLMVAANECAAAFLFRRAQPCMYRIHPTPTQERTQALQEACDGLGIVAGFSSRKPLTPAAVSALVRQVKDTHQEAPLQMAMRRLLAPAEYTVVPGEHFGLASSLYAHFTSPIRRYADVVVHRALRAHLRGHSSSTSQPSEWAALALHLNERSRKATRAEEDRTRQLAARHYANHVGSNVQGYVSALKGDGVLVQIRGATAFLPESLPLGTQVHAVIDKVDVTLGFIDLKRA
jgi:ribonuclease R